MLYYRHTEKTEEYTVLTDIYVPVHRVVVPYSPNILGINRYHLAVPYLKMYKHYYYGIFFFYINIARFKKKSVIGTVFILGQTRVYASIRGRLICDGWVIAVLSRSYFCGRTCAMWQ